MGRRKKEDSMPDIEPTELSEDTEAYESTKLGNVKLSAVSDTNKFVSTGSTILNLLLSNDIDCGFRKGSVVRLMGHESSGKTASVLSYIKEFCKNPTMNSTEFIYRDHEAGTPTNIEGMYGKEVKERLQITTPESASLEGEFKFISDVVSTKQAVIIEDSLDTLMSVKAKTLFEANGEAALEGGKLKEGAMAHDAKVMSSGFKLITGAIDNSDSILFLISQKRDSLDPFQTLSKFNTSGGWAVKHACSTVLAFSSSPTRDCIEREKRGLKQKVGQVVNVEVLKNRGTGHVNIGNPIKLYLYLDRGFVDQESVLDFLIETTQTFTKLGAGYIDVSKLLGFSEEGKPIAKRRSEILREIYYDAELFQKCRVMAGDEWRSLLKELYADIF